MKRALPAGAALLFSGLLLVGCGSKTKTVSATNTPPVAQAGTGTASSNTPTTTTTSTGSTSPKGSGHSRGTSASSTTRTAPEPAFAQQQQTTAANVTAAASLVRAQGYTPNEVSEYHPNQTLRVLIATRTGSSDGYDQRAFFFLADHYLGTDTKEPSASVKVLSQSDTEVTLAYPLYRKGDPLGSPSGGQATVHFQLDNGKLTPVGRIPPASSADGLSRN